MLLRRCLNVLGVLYRHPVRCPVYAIENVCWPSDGRKLLLLPSVG